MRRRWRGSRRARGATPPPPWRGTGGSGSRHRNSCREGRAAGGGGDGRPASLGFTEAGIAGAKIGLNDAGLGLAINGLVSDRDTWSRPKKPFHVRCWEVLAARSLDDALRAVAGSPRSCSSNFLIAKAGTSSPEVVDLELAPDTERRLAPEGGFLCHANHFLETDRLGIRPPPRQDRGSPFPP